MALDPRIKKVLVIGSGPIVIGQAAEFDYAGTQACRALKEEGLKVVLVNSNPATIMTDATMADAIYIEPLTIETVERIILKEKPDSLLANLGGQTGLNLAMKLAKKGFLDKHGVRLLGVDPLAIDKAEDRQLFKDTMESIGQPVIPSKVVETVADALAFAEEISYPVIVRPAFTMGGSGGGIAGDREALVRIAEGGLRQSPITQILVEKCISGWKEIEFEVMRDGAGNVITICSMENLDPVGVHTGDSIVAAPALTLSDKEFQMLRKAAMEIITALNIKGGCNCQFALHPTSFEYAVIEVNPRVSRSSALASKATGYPIAKVTAKIAMGYTLDEITNAVTGKTCACFEPAIDYVVLKFPKWPFDKFVYAKRQLGTQMKATGEVMAIGSNFEQAIMKAVRGAELSLDTLRLPKLASEMTEDIRAMLHQCDDQRLFVVFEALLRGVDPKEIHAVTMIDPWFISKLGNLAKMEQRLMDLKEAAKARISAEAGAEAGIGVGAEAGAGNGTEAATSGGDIILEDGVAYLEDELYLTAKKMGYTDGAIKRLTGLAIRRPIYAAFKMVDTCAGEFAAETPYFYSDYNRPGPDSDMAGENEALAFTRRRRAGETQGRCQEGDESKKRVIVFGSGPIRIGQGIEFDYASVHCAWILQKLGFEVIIINNNPETVSTDFDTADRLYFEPLTPEDVMQVIHTEQPYGVVVAFGGQTAIKLTKHMEKAGVRILGTSGDSIDAAEDRERFDALLEELNMERPKGASVTSTAEALTIAEELGYPVLLRPSYVLGGQNMIIAFCREDVEEYMAIILAQNIENPVLIDKYMMGTEIEVDAICDGEDILIPGIMEHIERAGVHSGDSIAVYPAWNLSGQVTERILECTRKLALALNTKGLVNIQYVVCANKVYVIEVNPRSSRTIPYITKVTGVPMVDLATRAMLGEKLADMGFGTGLYKTMPYVAVKVPVFSFEKLSDVDTQLGPEMKSTGEVLGIGKTIEEALYKGLVAAGYSMKKQGGVLMSVRETDHGEIAEVARKFYEMGFKLYATRGTAAAIAKAGMAVETVHKIYESGDNVATLIDSGKVDYVISTSTKGRIPTRDSVKIRRRTVERSIPCLTSIDTANALADSLMSRYSQSSTELVDINAMRREPVPLNFVKMQGCGNDNIFFDCLTEDLVLSPESLSLWISNRRYGVGGDGVVLILPSDKADARMRMFNTDGSEGVSAGNAIRSVAKYLYDNGIVNKLSMTIETLGGLRELRVFLTNGKVSTAQVNMGAAILTPSLVPLAAPLALEQEPVVGREVEIQGLAEPVKVTCLSLGNPHCVVFRDSLEDLDIAKIGPLFEASPLFPERVNTEFVSVKDRHNLRMRVWERGSGETWACGTGACAAAVAAVLNGYCDYDEDITVKLKGGDLVVRYADHGTVYMTGETKKLFEGVVEI